MVAVGNIILIRNTLNNAEPLLQTFGKFIRRGLHRRPIYRIADMLCLSPLLTLIVQSLHDCQRKRPCLRVSMGLPEHPHAHLIKPCIAKGNRRIPVVQQIVNHLSLFQPGQRAVLPQNRRHIRHGPKKALMPAPKPSVAQFQTLIQNLPETLHISLGRTGHIHQIDRHNALVEPAVELMTSVLVPL